MIDFSHPVVIIAEAVIAGVILAVLGYIVKQLRTAGKTADKLEVHETLDAEKWDTIDRRLERGDRKFDELQAQVAENTAMTRENERTTQHTKETTDKIWNYIVKNGRGRIDG